MSSIKISRAISKSSLSSHPQSAAAMLKHLPIAVVKQATSAALAAMIEGLWVACQESKAIAERQACDQGYIWDAAQNRSREIAT